MSKINTISLGNGGGRFQNPSFPFKFSKAEVTLLSKQLEYWFRRYKQGFYKFMEPCHHAHYRGGDSWTEELSMSRKVFNRAFDLIGVRYKSRSAFQRARDKFKGKLYASYYDRGENKTYYIRNHAFMSDLLPKRKCSETTKVPLSSALQEGEKVTSSPSTERPLRNGHFGRYRLYKDTKITSVSFPPKSPSLKLKEKSPEREEGRFQKEKKDLFRLKNSNETANRPKDYSDLDLEKAQKMRDIWIRQTQGKIPSPPLSGSFAHRLVTTLEKTFANSLKAWEVYCQRVASSRFLTGQTGGSFKLWLVRALHPEMIEKIKQGYYGVNPALDFERVSEEVSKTLKTKEVQDELEASDLPPWEKAFRKSLVQEIGGATYASWFREASFTHEQDLLVISCSSLFKADWIKKQFPYALERLVKTHKNLFTRYQVVQKERGL